MNNINQRETCKKNILFHIDGVELPAEIRHKVMNNGTLSIKSVHRSTETGRFVCQVRDNFENSVEGFIDVQVMGNTYILFH